MANVIDLSTINDYALDLMGARLGGFPDAAGDCSHMLAAVFAEQDARYQANKILALDPAFKWPASPFERSWVPGDVGLPGWTSYKPE